MADFQNQHLQGKSVEQLIDELAQPVAEPGSVIHHAYLVAINAKISERQVEVARLQQEAAERSVAWAKVQGIATMAATVIALAALLVALF